MYYLVEYDGGGVEIGEFETIEDAKEYLNEYISRQPDYWYVDGFTIEDEEGNEVYFAR